MESQLTNIMFSIDNNPTICYCIRLLLISDNYKNTIHYINVMHLKILSDGNKNETVAI